MSGRLRVLLRRVPGAGLVLALTGCLGDGTGPDWSDPATIDFAPSLEVDLPSMTRKPSGLYVKDLTTGSGPEVVLTDEVVVGYTGWLPNGSVFDATPASSPVRFPLRQVIPGWQEGVQGMRPGGVRLLVIPPHLGYGAQGVASIPPNSTLVFRVELVSIVGK